MKVFLVSNDVAHYQFFLPTRDEDALTLTTNCTPRAAKWIPPVVSIFDPKLLLGDCFSFGGSALILSPRATDVLRQHMSAAGELLPLPYQGQIYTVLNVLNCIDALDGARSIQVIDPETGIKLHFTKYVFDPHRLHSRSPLFKIPETGMVDTFLVEGLLSPDEEFRAVVEREQLRGLVFDLLWTDEQES